jgi:hypothetical protein
MMYNHNGIKQQYDEIGFSINQLRITILQAHVQHIMKLALNPIVFQYS